MNTRHLSFADGTHRQFIGSTFSRSAHSTIRSSQRTHHPLILAVQIFQNTFCQCNGSTTRRIQFMHMMCFHHRYLIIREVIHNLGKILVDRCKHSHAQAEIRRPEQCLSFLLAQSAHFLSMFTHPSGTSRYHFHSIAEGTQAIVVSHSRCCKLDGYICRTESFRLKILTVIYINNTYNLMSAGNSNLLYLFAHLSISN